MTREKSLAVAFVATLVMVLGASPARATDDLSLNVEAGSESVQPGDTVTVTLDIANLSAAVNGVQVRLSYDTTVMTLIDVAPTDLVAAGLIVSPAAGWVEINQTDTAGDIDWAAVIIDDAIQLNHTVATLTFTVIDEGTTSVTFRADAAPFLTKLTVGVDNSTITPNKFDSGLIASRISLYG